jgi:cation-transporting ATPase E
MSKLRGLTSKEISERKRAGLVNTTVNSPSKSVAAIIRDNIFTYFNFVFLVLAILLVIIRSYRDLTFLPIIIANSLIGIFQELRAKSVLDQLSILNAPETTVIRDGKRRIIKSRELVLDDIIVLKSGDQIPADAVILDGSLSINEALLTGEADEIEKSIDSELLSGSFVVSGEAIAKLTRVGAASYASQLTLKAKAMKSGEQSEIIRSLNSFVRLAGIAIIPIGLILVAEQLFLKGLSFELSVQAMIADIIGMIPEGLFLLASVTLALSALRLARSKVLLHDMKSIESLARSDILCVDKTGTITSPDMSLTEIISPTREILFSSTPLQKSSSKAPNVASGAFYGDESLLIPLRDFIASMPSDNATMRAISAAFPAKKAPRPLETVPFSSKYKFSAIMFERGRSLFLGAPEILLGDQIKSYRRLISSYASSGKRVLIFGSAPVSVKKSTPTPPKSFTPLCFLILENPVRAEAKATFEYFKNQGVAVKVISGDDARTVSAVAHQAGIENADKYIDLTPDSDLEKLVKTYTIFGRVTPDQKLALIKLFKRHHTVAMTGDGVNDVLALKEADCSIAMASGSSAAVQASAMVLLESDFSKMPSIVTEGRRVVNNLERTGSLFLVKNIFSFLMAFAAILFGFVYPLVPTQVSLITMFTIGIPSFFLAQVPSFDLIRGNFMKNILRRAAPAAFANFILICLAVVFSGIFGFDRLALGTITTLVWATTGFIFLFRLCRPFNPVKILIFASCLLGFLLCFLFLPWLFATHLDIGFYPYLLALALSTLSLPLQLLFSKLLSIIKNKVF